MSDPDQIDMMSPQELRTELRKLVENSEQLQKENAELRKELVAAVELMEGFNKAVAEWNSHDQ